MRIYRVIPPTKTRLGRAPCPDDCDSEEAWINDTSRAFVARRDSHELMNVVLTREQVEDLVERMLKSSGPRIGLSQPLVDYHELTPNDVG